MIRQVDPELFARDDINNFLDQQRNVHVDDTVFSLNPERVLSTSFEELLEKLVNDLSLNVPQLGDRDVHAPVDEWIDVSPRPGEDHRRGPYGTRRGTRQIVRIRFTGEARFFDVAPSRIGGQSRGEIERDFWRLTLTFDYYEATNDRVSQFVENAIQNIELALEQLRMSVEKYNADLPKLVTNRLNVRIEKAQADRKNAEAIGFKIQRRSEEPIGIQLPKARKQVRIAKPKPKTVLQEDEYYLQDEDYEDILKTLQSMSLVFERSPEAFVKMQEEHIRFHFLVLLNGLYDGEATGETFNSGGKTDILINAHGRTIFIAECKFWDGPKEFTNAIDQLFGYTTFRDTKVALLIFNRRIRFTTVLKGIASTIPNHPNYEKTIQKSATTWRCTFSQPKDTERKLTLTIMAFDIRTS